MTYVAILGCGTVGSGTAELLLKNGAEIRRRTGAELALKHILVRRPKPESPYAPYMVTDLQRILDDPSVTLVAECIGGTGDALDYVRRCLRAGRHVATSNKELVAKHGVELSELARENGVSFLFEAAVGGGIPCLHPLQFGLSANRVDECLGIVNGTTNFILTGMESAGTPYAEALREAQRLGYAEADPTADVAGLDALRKVCILSGLSFGLLPDPDMLRAEGITEVTPEDLQAAVAAGYRLRLIARAARQDGRVSIGVAPQLVPEGSPLALPKGSSNGVLVRGDAVGDVFFAGAGAGALPTGSAVAGDLVQAALAAERPLTPDWRRPRPEELADEGERVSRFLLRSSRLLAGSIPVEGCPGYALTPPLTLNELKTAAGEDRPHAFRLLG